MTKPKGYFKYVLAVDVETSGMSFHKHSDDPSYDPDTGNSYQVVSIGVIVADVATFTPIEELYLEIKWDGKSLWSEKAEAVHGLSKQHLEKHGVDSSEAVEAIGNLIVNYWGFDVPICVLGHNVATFDLWFIKRLMRSHDVHLRFGNRYIDTNSIAVSTLGTFNSDDAFTAVGLPERDPSQHNALVDAHASLTVARTVKKLWSSLVEPELQ